MTGSVSNGQIKTKRYILTVSSKVDELFFYSMLLQRFAYRVCTANTTGQALEMASVAVPALVVADLFLPGMSGVDLMRLLRQDPRTASLPVIFLIPADDKIAEMRCAAANAAACIQKPVLAETLYRAVQAALEVTPRANIRVPTRLSVTVNNVTLDSIEGECTSVLSEHGMYVRTLKPYDRNDELSVTLTINGRRIAAGAKVLYSHRFGDGPFVEPGMGLRFIRLAPEDHEFIRQFIRNEVTSGIA